MSINYIEYSWLPYEPAWAAVTHARVKGGCLSASIELTKDSSYSINSELGLAEGILQSFASLETSAAFSRKQHEKRVVYVEFAGLEND